MIPVGTDLAAAYVNGQTSEQQFVLHLSLFLSSFLKEHCDLLETKVGLPKPYVLGCF
jgi:hypothetical protein